MHIKCNLYIVVFAKARHERKCPLKLNGFYLCGTVIAPASQVWPSLTSWRTWLCYYDIVTCSISHCPYYRIDCYCYMRDYSSTLPPVSRLTAAFFKGVILHTKWWWPCYCLAQASHAYIVLFYVEAYHGFTLRGMHGPRATKKVANTL